ncbi:MAG: IS21 family transposase, partial [Actinobacteria bacterium]|nr:IS21 family transposase [Actinomycetota bacterium]
MERWAEIRRMSGVEGLSQREIHRRTGFHRDTIRRALGLSKPPSYGPRPARASKLDPYRGEVERLLKDDATLSGVRVREELEALGYAGGKTILDDLLRELRPRYLPLRTFQRTVYRPGELCQFDLCEPRREVPVGFGQARRGWMVTAELPYSRAFAAALVFSKELPDLLWGMSRCLARLGALPEKLVWDREGAIHRGGGQPTEGFAAYCGELSTGWVILDPGDCQAKGALERTHRFVHGNFEAGRCFANPLDFQDQLDRWSDKINERVHRTTRAVVSERLAEERQRMRGLPAA